MRVNSAHCLYAAITASALNFLAAGPLNGFCASLPALIRLSQRLLVANKDHWEQVTTGDKRRGRSTYVFARQGQQYRRWGTPIRHDRGAGIAVNERGDADARGTLVYPQPARGRARGARCSHRRAARS